MSVYRRGETPALLALRLRVYRTAIDECRRVRLSLAHNPLRKVAVLWGAFRQLRTFRRQHPTFSDASLVPYTPEEMAEAKAAFLK